MSAALEIELIHRDGQRSCLPAVVGASLMEVLREAASGIEGTCGGAMSCGTCHVYLDATSLSRCGVRSEDEQAMLEAIGDFVEIREGSRLSCQITLNAAHQGLSVTVAPAV